MVALVLFTVALVLAPGAIGLQHGLSRTGLRVATEMGLDAETQMRSAQNQSQNIVKQLEMIEHHLRICSAFAHPKPLDVYLVHIHDAKSHGLHVTKEAPIAYKECRDLMLQMREGDKLNFKAGGFDVGTFSAVGLPTRNDGTTLLLIPRQRESNSMALAFESHAFANLRTPQLAVVDAYRGLYMDDEVMIMDTPEKDNKEASLLETSKPAPRAEGLKYNSVAALQLGHYQLALMTTDGYNITMPVPLHVQPGGTYLVMRVGSDANEKDNYPKELLVFPESGAASSKLNGVLLLVLLCSAVHYFGGSAQ